MAKKKFQLVKGMSDILPQEQKYWDYVFQTVEQVFRLGGFKKITIPILEFTELFEKSTGQDTDIVQKEMYTFTDLGGNLVSLCPEGTPSVVRAYIEHGMAQWQKPVKLYYIGPMFRYERPQAGRRRQFWQIGYEVFGDGSAASDVEVILIFYQILEKLGISGFTLQINSIGCSKCRAKFKEELLFYYKGRLPEACANCKERFKKNPLRLLDCKERKCQKLVSLSPQIVDLLCSDCKGHFQEVLEFLDDLEIPYNLNPYLVRGLDYYNRTVFEFWPSGDGETSLGSQTALGGGGRYDDLVELFGGKPTPATGAALGVERVIQLIKDQKLKISEPSPIFVFVVQLGDEAKKKSVKLIYQLRKAGIGAESSLGRESIKSQMKTAAKLGISTTLIIGQKEVLDDTVIIKDMNSGVQETVNFNEIIDELKKRLPR